MSAVLWVDGLRLVRRRRCLIEDATFEIGTGVTVLLGPNGAGKSTLLRALAGVDRPHEGSIRLLGDPHRQPGEASYRSAIGYLPQEPGFPGRFTVQEAIGYAAWLQGVGTAEAVRRTLADLHLEREADVALRILSGGTRRRAMLGTAIVHRPQLLLLDEPTVGMDAHHRHLFRQSLEAVAATSAVVLSTHVFSDVDGLADRALVLGDQRLAFDGPIDDLLALGEELPAPRGRGSESPVDRAVRRLGSGR